MIITGKVIVERVCSGECLFEDGPCKGHRAVLNLREKVSCPNPEIAALLALLRTPGAIGWAVPYTWIDTPPDEGEKEQYTQWSRGQKISGAATRGSSATR